MRGGNSAIGVMIMALKRLCVVASHEPNRDPRIDWVSRFAVDLFQVTVIVMAEPARSGSALDSRNGYQIIRLRQSFQGLFGFAWAFWRCFGTKPICWLSLAAAITLTPLLAACFLLN